MHRKATLLWLIAVLLVCSGCTHSGDDSRNDSNQNNDNAFCGNALVEAGEECDQGSANSDSLSNACRTDCRLPWCGDGVKDDGETCDEGAANGSNRCSTTCAFSGPEHWTEVQPPNSPPCRSWAAMVFDSLRDRIVLFGGYDGQSFGDTWAFDGQEWSLATIPNSPSPRHDHKMVYDAARGVAVLFGAGYSSDHNGGTWELSGDTWTQVTESGPLGRAHHGMAYDASRSVVVLFGGIHQVGDSTILGDTWEFDGTQWIEVATSNAPEPRHSHAMAYDASSGRVVLTGGALDQEHIDTWEYDGVDWVEASPDTPPPGRHDHAMTYHAGLQRLILFGGRPTAAEHYPALADTWEYMAGQWEETTPAISPLPRRGAAAAYDVNHDWLVLFGGQDASVPPALFCDTWLYLE